MILFLIYIDRTQTAYTHIYSLRNTYQQY